MTANKLRLFFVLTILSLLSVKVYAHPDKHTHANEIMAALGFEYNQDIYDWLCFISSDMIDDYHPIYQKIREIYPSFTISPPMEHRCFFHWGYNGKPWNNYLDKIVDRNAKKTYGARYREYVTEMAGCIFDILVKEQKRRNRIINTRTEHLFGFASGGRDAKYANFFAAMAYDLHILGDYTSLDNSVLNGLVEFNTLINGIISSMNQLDSKQGKNIVKAIKEANSNNKNVQLRADDIMEVILDMLPQFIKNAQSGSIKRRLEKQGYKFVK